MSSSRDKIIARIQEALAVAAPRHHASSGGGDVESTSVRFREWLPSVGGTAVEQHALFRRQCDLLRAELIDCADLAAAASWIAGRAQLNHWKRIACHPGKLLDPLIALLPASVETMRVAGDYEKPALEQCDAAVTECESLVAQTGSVCVTALSSGGRALSVLPPEHIVIARRRQLVPDLTAAFDQLARKYGSNYPSFISFISGPSRTGDIERILVLGAHGPRKLSICLIEE